jgi:gamma-glutamyl-gamma-aminobutyrate hydrolase PuuD
MNLKKMFYNDLYILLNMIGNKNKNKNNKMKSDLNVGILMSDVKPVSYSNWVETWFPTLVDNVNVEFINARSERVREDIDLLLLIGGSDIDSMNYGDKPGIYNDRPNIHLEWFDKVMLPKYVERTATGKLGIFGTCRGIQTLNVLFGGKLSQYIPQDYSGKDTRGKLVDKLTICSEFKSDWEAFKKEIGEKSNEILTNSLHKQGFYHYNMAKSLRAIAVNSGFGNNIEIARHQSLPIFGHQGHWEETGMTSIARYTLTRLISEIK